MYTFFSQSLTEIKTHAFFSADEIGHLSDFA